MAEPFRGARGVETTLRLQRHAVSAGDEVLLVDDWAETGKAPASRRLIELCGGRHEPLLFTKW